MKENPSSTYCQFTVQEEEATVDTLINSNVKRRFPYRLDDRTVVLSIKSCSFRLKSTLKSIFTSQKFVLFIFIFAMLVISYGFGVLLFHFFDATIGKPSIVNKL